jgi:serine/threonine protein kinase
MSGVLASFGQTGSEGGSALYFDESGNFSAPAAFGTYRVLHQTGSGVLGPVFRAFDSPRDRLVAIKVFRLDLLPEQVVRLADGLRQLQASAPVHPLIVPLIDAGLEGTTPYLVMAFQPGETLDIVLRRAAPLPIARALCVLRPLAATLSAAAETGVFHGALHPRDVFVPDEGDELAGVTGFGIVQALESSGLVSPVLRRPYVAPERGTGSAWGTRADVFSLGVMAHEMLTGRRPAPSGEQDGVFAKELAPEHRVRLRRVLSTALADQDEQRFESPEAFIDALEEIAQRPRSSATKAAGLAAVPAAAMPEVSEASPAEMSDVFLPESEFEQPVAFEKPAEPEPVLVAGEPDAEPEPLAGAAVSGRTDLDGDFKEDFQEEDIQKQEEDIQKEEEVITPEDVIARAPIVPPAAKVDPWVDGALASPTYQTPQGVFDAPVLQPARRAPVVFKTVLYAAAGLLLGVGGGLIVARLWFNDPVAQAPRRAGVTAPAASRPEAALPRDESVPPVPTEAPFVAPAPMTAPDRREPAAAADVRRAVVQGRLVVRSQPSGALVTIDGRSFGETPLIARGLAPGTYDVRVAHPGHVPRTERVTIRAAAPERTLSVTLARGLDVTRPSSPTTTSGAIDVDSRPRGARVIVDGRFVGLAPLRLADVQPGDHQVTLELGGYRSATGRVRVDAGRTAELETTLRAVE